jgi:uncharacterized membrane protein
MSAFFFIKVVHLLSAAVLFGTGIGAAFFMLMSHFSSNLAEKYYAVRITVLADWVFTAPAVVLQPLTGLLLIKLGGYTGDEPWLIATYILYAIAGLCWLPVVALQLKMRHLLREALVTGQALDLLYHRLFRVWFLLGWPAFFALLAIFFLMVTRPA